MRTVLRTMFGWYSLNTKGPVPMLFFLIASGSSSPAVASLATKAFQAVAMLCRKGAEGAFSATRTV